MTNRPKLFVSYSWTNPEHENWVLQLASQLVECGIEVILDKWELREGHDAVAFMEQMVTDPSITKVILVCDVAYATKADGRDGGVGTETQIISPEIYSKRDQDKFVAVIAEKDSNGKAPVPTYYKSRIHIDLSESEAYPENFESLVRWVFDKPLNVRPEIGSPPSYVTGADSPGSMTSAAALRAVAAIKANKPSASGDFLEYLEKFAASIEAIRSSTMDPREPNDENVIRVADSFTHSRDEFVHVVSMIMRYSNVSTHVSGIHRCFESMINMLEPSPELGAYKRTDFDPCRFIVHELFLFTLATLIHGEEFEAAAQLLSLPYYVAGNADLGKEPTVTFCVFCKDVESLEIRNKRQKLGRLSLRADMLRDRSKVSALDFRDIMQADLICFLRNLFTPAEFRQHWWPVTLVYTVRQHGPFESFARSTSREYLDRFLVILGLEDSAEFQDKISKLEKDPQDVPMYGFDRLNISRLVGARDLGKRT